MVDTYGDGTASALNRELTQLLVDAGVQRGFTPRTEWPVRGGRLDVVWTLEVHPGVPGLDQPLPAVGFEIESSWRTRKHVKGDLLNLQDAGVALGVIVLAGADPRDDSLRRFAATLVDRPGAPVLIWTEHDVRNLADGSAAAPQIDAIAVTGPEAPTRATSDGATPEAAAGVEHRGKYRPVWSWLRQQEHHDHTLTFADVEDILGFPLPTSCRTYVQHWHGYDGSAVARAIADAGWHAHHVNLDAGTVTLSPGAPNRRP